MFKVPEQSGEYFILVTCLSNPPIFLNYRVRDNSSTLNVFYNLSMSLRLFVSNTGFSPKKRFTSQRSLL